MSNRELSTIDKLVETEENTNSDGTVNVTIDGWEESEHGYEVDVSFVTPTGGVEEETMKFPQPGGDLHEYKFYRLVKSAGLGMRNADLLEGTIVHAVNDGGNWRLVVEDERPLSARALSALRQALVGVIDLPWKEIIVVGFWMLSLGTIALTMLLLLL